MTFLLHKVGFSYVTLNEGANPSRSCQQILKDLSITISAGSRIAVQGPSGVGKSTLISILGLLTGTKQIVGDILYTDSMGRVHEYQGLPVTSAEALRRTEFGFALQSSYLLPHLTVEENMAIPLGLTGHSSDERRFKVLDLLAKADKTLLARAGALPRELSGGQQQRVAVLRALVHDPLVVFADEPFSALDEGNKEAILDILFEWQEKGMAGNSDSKSHPLRTLILVCHDPSVPKKRNARSLYMHHGHHVDFPDPIKA